MKVFVIFPVNFSEIQQFSRVLTMTPADLEKWTKKILNLISVDGTAVFCTYKSMSIAEWETWRRDGNQDVEMLFGF